MAREGGGRPRGGGEGGKRHCVPIGIHIPVYMNRVLPKWYKKVSSYLSLDCTFKKGLLHGMSYTPEKKSCMKSCTHSTDRLDKYIFCGTKAARYHMQEKNLRED